MICKYCGKEIKENINGFCDNVCQGKYYGEKALTIDYGKALCEACGEEFEKKSTNQIYCSDSCRNKQYYKASRKTYELICEKCGKIFESTNKAKKYCSDECKKMLYKYICVRCGKEFESSTRNRKICSPECLKLKRYTKICEYCGIEYETTDKKQANCSSRCRDDSRRKTHKQFVEELIEEHEGIIVPLEMYVSANDNIKCQCLLCGKEYNKPSHRYIGRYKEGCSCRLSKGEVEVRRWLEEHNIIFKEQYSFDDLKYKNKLLFDFAIIEDSKVKILIEYDGVQHYKSKGWGEKKFRTQRLKDSIKDNYCKENNIELLRIPYWEQSVDKLLRDALGMSD